MACGVDPRRYAANAFMDKTDVLSKPVNEIIEVKKGKSKKKSEPRRAKSTGERFCSLKAVESVNMCQCCCGNITAEGRP